MVRFEILSCLSKDESVDTDTRETDLRTGGDRGEYGEIPAMACDGATAGGGGLCD